MTTSLTDRSPSTVVSPSPEVSQLSLFDYGERVVGGGGRVSECVHVPRGTASGHSVPPSTDAGRWRTDRGRLADADPLKWLYQAHTDAKHRLLEQYLRGYVPILARAGYKRLLLVDGFAGRGRYINGEPGSPLVLAQVADELTDYLSGLRRPIYVEIECAFIEPHPDNHASLQKEISAARLTARNQVRLHPPVHETFEAGIRPLIAQATRQRTPIFVFADPFGYADIPLSTMREILAAPQAEVFLTFMVQYVNRFFCETDRAHAFASLFGVSSTTQAGLRERLRDAPDREQELRDYYLRQLRTGAGARYVWPFRVLHEQGDSTLYYLVHASRHVRAFRLMKDTMKRQGVQGEYTFFGRQDFTRRARPLLLRPDTDTGPLKEHMLKRLAGRSLPYEAMLDTLYPDPACYYFVKEHFHGAAQELRRESRISVTPVTSTTERGLQGQDILHFPR